ncbi:hypothetical protein AGLY_006521 [Aphis glycines]|uniref:Uncharacterized protein n=1 Tax=Aphis glycines TaxID=307491 RepID=A0A6G0TSK8_APHGL|nr:hypothetical protein AGLY_006521 [Aphis glycines]
MQRRFYSILWGAKIRLLGQTNDEAITLKLYGISRIVGNHYNLKMSMSLFDSVAKASVLFIKIHSGYSSCFKYKQDEKHVYSVYFPEIEFIKSTDKDFLNQIDADHHNGQAVYSSSFYNTTIKVIEIVAMFFIQNSLDLAMIDRNKSKPDNKLLNGIYFKCNIKLFKNKTIENENEPENHTKLILHSSNPSTSSIKKYLKVNKVPHELISSLIFKITCKNLKHTPTFTQVYLNRLISQSLKTHTLKRSRHYITPLPPSIKIFTLF